MREPRLFEKPRKHIARLTQAYDAADLRAWGDIALHGEDRKRKAERRLACHIEVQIEKAAFAGRHALKRFGAPPVKRRHAGSRNQDLAMAVQQCKAGNADPAHVRGHVSA